MSEIEGIVDRLKTVWYGPSWHGPAVWTVLEGVTAEEARARPLAGRHSIWELAGHIAAWRNATVRGLRGGTVSVAEAENFPEPVNDSEAEWRRVLASLERTEQAVLESVARLEDGDLGRIVHGESGPYSIRFMLNGIAHHDLYHAGQIQMLRSRSGAALG